MNVTKFYFTSPRVRLCEGRIKNSFSNTRSERSQSHICYLKLKKKKERDKFGRNRFI